VIPDWLARLLCSLGLHHWTPWEDKNMVWQARAVDGRACQWCGTVQNRCVRPGGDN
jgi:hypothetical protein